MKHNDDEGEKTASEIGAKDPVGDAGRHRRCCLLLLTVPPHRDVLAWPRQCMTTVRMVELTRGREDGREGRG